MSALQSCLYEGVVVHQRRERPVRSFRYRVFMTYVELAELEELHRRLSPILSSRRVAPVHLRRSDYHGDPSVGLERSVADLVFEKTGRIPARVCLLTNLRMFGHCFNPVSFYYCFDAQRQLQAVVAEVTSTPWGERHAYVLEPGGAPVDKQLHVSPFMAMDHRYECDSPAPDRTLRLTVRSYHDGLLAFAATLALRRRELTRTSLALALARHPLHGAQVQARIYAQAVRLALRGAHYHPHPQGES